MFVTKEDNRIIVAFPAESETDEAFFTELKFLILAEQAKEETKWYSFTRQKIQSPAYQKIIEMGKSAIPILLKHLDLQPVLWFHALHTLTGDNPVPPEHTGDIALMTKDWLQWGKKRKLI